MIFLYIFAQVKIITKKFEETAESVFFQIKMFYYWQFSFDTWLNLPITDPLFLTKSHFEALNCELKVIPELISIFYNQFVKVANH